MSSNDDPISLAAEYWFGYGSWNAPYWFIGPEPGKAKDEGENLKERCSAWLELCPNGPASGGLVDAYQHHKAFGHLKFFEKRAPKPEVPTQPTWRQLIRLLLAYQNGSAPSDKAIADYQATKWGRSNGEACVIEMSALAMNSLSDEQDLRERFRSERIATIRAKIESNHPKIVVMYGGGERLRPLWDQIACADPSVGCFTDEMIDGLTASFAVQSGTKFAVARHPVSHGSSNDYWIGIGERLRRADGRP
jgi:hypothetical protein